MKWAWAWLVLAMATLCACHRPGSTGTEQKHATAPRLTIVTDRLSLESVDKLPLDEARRAYPEVFRLRPDRRFLIAVGEAQSMATRAASVRLHLAWRDDAWHIDSSGAKVGEVPEVANYERLRTVLQQWSASLVSSSASAAAPAPAKPADLAEVRAECDRFEPAAAIRALQKIDTMWPASGKPDPELAALAGRAFTVLCAQGLDTFEMADLLRARALAAFALAEALGRGPEGADEAILAASMGYAPDAVRIAGALAGDDPVRLYAEGRTPALVEAAAKPGASRRTRYLALLSLGATRDEKAWREFQQTQFKHEGFSLPVLRAAAELKTFSMNAQLGELTLYAALGQLSPAAPAPAADAETDQPFDLAQAAVAQFIGAVQRVLHLQAAGLVRQFEAELGKQSANARGPIWDAHAVRALHRGAFYSGLHLTGRTSLDQQGSVEATRQFAAYLQRSPQGPASQFAQWYGDLSAILSGGGVTDRHFDDLVTLTALGSPSVRRLVPELRNTYYKRRDAAAIVAARVAGRLDARPLNVAFMQTVAAYPLEDFRMVERLCRAWLAQGWADDSTEGTTTGHCLWFTGDTAGLSTLLADRGIDVPVRVQLLYQYALSPGSSEKVCRPAFERLAAESGYAEAPVQAWSYYLWHELKDYAGAQRAVEGFLAHHGTSGFLGSIFVGRRARLISVQGRPEEAWRVIQPALAFGQGSVMTWGADILVKLGRLDEAEKLARQVVERYPYGAEGRSALAEILWRQKRYGDAALVLDPPEQGYKVGGSEFRDELTPRFGAVFAKAPDDDVLAALAALKAQGVDAAHSAYLVAPLAAAGRYDLAFRAQSTTFLKGRMWGLGEQALKGFEYLEKAKGRPEAIVWIQGVISAPQRETALEAFFNKKAWGLVWDAVPAAEEPGLSEWVWLMRAGAVTADEAVARAHRTALLAELGNAKPGADRTIGRYLVGLEPRAAVLGAATAPVDRCKAAYFFGLQDIAAGRYEEASAWYQLVHGTCGNTWAWRLDFFAWSTLNEWYAFDRTLQAAAAKRVW